MRLAAGDVSPELFHLAVARHTGGARDCDFKEFLRRACLAVNTTRLIKPHRGRTRIVSLSALQLQWFAIDGHKHFHDCYDEGQFLLLA
jgi:hypothetical protein